jgi:Cu+-exporting ATPase
MSRPPQDLAATAVDPVCGMSVDVSTAKHTMDYEGHTYYFCSPGCKQTFAASPAKYAGGTTAGHAHH